MPNLAQLLDAATLFRQHNTLAATWARLSLAAKQTAASSPLLPLPAFVYRLRSMLSEVLILRRLCVFWLSTPWRQSVLEANLGSVAALSDITMLKKKTVNEEMRPGQTDHCGVSFLVWETNRMNCTDRGRCKVNFPTTMHPPAAISNTQLVKMRYLCDTQLLLQPIEHLQEISAQGSEETRPLVKTHTVHYCVCGGGRGSLLLIREGKK